MAEWSARGDVGSIMTSSAHHWILLLALFALSEGPNLSLASRGSYDPLKDPDYWAGVEHLTDIDKANLQQYTHNLDGNKHKVYPEFVHARLQAEEQQALREHRRKHSHAKAAWRTGDDRNRHFHDAQNSQNSIDDKPTKKDRKKSHSTRASRVARSRSRTLPPVNDMYWSNAKYPQEFAYQVTRAESSTEPTLWPSQTAAPTNRHVERSGTVSLLTKRDADEIKRIQPDLMERILGNPFTLPMLAEVGEKQEALMQSPLATLSLPSPDEAQATTPKSSKPKLELFARSSGDPSAAKKVVVAIVDGDSAAGEAPISNGDIRSGTDGGDVVLRVVPGTAPPAPVESDRPPSTVNPPWKLLATATINADSLLLASGSVVNHPALIPLGSLEPAGADKMAPRQRVTPGPHPNATPNKQANSPKPPYPDVNEVVKALLKQALPDRKDLQNLEFPERKTIQAAGLVPQPSASGHSQQANMQKIANLMQALDYHVKNQKDPKASSSLRRLHSALSLRFPQVQSQDPSTPATTTTTTTTTMPTTMPSTSIQETRTTSTMSTTQTGPTESVIKDAPSSSSEQKLDPIIHMSQRTLDFMKQLLKRNKFEAVAAAGFGDPPLSLPGPPPPRGIGQMSRVISQTGNSAQLSPHRVLAPNPGPQPNPYQQQNNEPPQPPVQVGQTRQRVGNDFPAPTHQKPIIQQSPVPQQPPQVISQNNPSPMNQNQNEMMNYRPGQNAASLPAQQPPAVSGNGPANVAHGGPTGGDPSVFNNNLIGLIQSHLSSPRQSEADSAEPPAAIPPKPRGETSGEAGQNTLRALLNLPPEGQKQGETVICPPGEVCVSSFNKDGGRWVQEQVSSFQNEDQNGFLTGLLKTLGDGRTQGLENVVFHPMPVLYMDKSGDQQEPNLQPHQQNSPPLPETPKQQHLDSVTIEASPHDGSFQGQRFGQAGQSPQLAGFQMPERNPFPGSHRRQSSQWQQEPPGRNYKHSEIIIGPAEELNLPSPNPNYVSSFGGAGGEVAPLKSHSPRMVEVVI